MSDFPKEVILPAGYRNTVAGPEPFFDYLVLLLHPDGTVTWRSVRENTVVTDD